MLSNVRGRLEELSSRQQALSAELDPSKESKFLEFYVGLIPRVLNAERCSVFVHDPANGKVWLKAGTKVAERGIEVLVQDSIVGKVIATGQPMIARELESRMGAHRMIDTTTGFVTREILCVPIRSTDGTRVTGAIEALNKKGGGFTEDDQGFLTEVGAHFQGILDSIYLGQEAVQLGRTAVTTAVRVVVTGFIALGSSIFILTVVGIYGGLPLLFFG